MIKVPGAAGYMAIIPTTITASDGKVYRSRPIRWSFTDASPYEVRFTVIDYTSGTTAEWTFARNLLADGRFKAVGELDVHVRPDGSSIIVDVQSPKGHAALTMDAAHVEEFLRGTFRRIPLETGWTETLIPLVDPPVAEWAKAVGK